MRKPIYASNEHEIIIKAYILMLKEFVKDISTKRRWEHYLEVMDIIIEYHNNYGQGVKENNWYDWVMILPLNLSVMTNGFFAGIVTKGNANIVRSYKVVLNEMLQDVIDKIEKLEPVNE
jgi:hypothetical protein